MNTYIIGDVYGCYYTLKYLIAQLPKDADIIFVGDLVDRGNFSKEVVEFMIERSHRAILGNHEAGIDTGCVADGRLSALELGSLRIYEQKLDFRDVKDENSMEI